MPKGVFITPAQLDKMEQLRAKGLSNSQIGIELGLTYRTICRHLGRQPDMNRAKYGSIISHSHGESFDQNPPKESEIPPEKRRPSAIRLENTTHTFRGKDMMYRVSSDGYVRISLPTGTAIDLTKNDFYTMLSELCDVGEALGKM